MKKSIILKSGLFLSTIFCSLSTLAAESDNNLAKAAFTQLGDEASQYSTYAWPVVISITVSLIGIKLFKKYANRAS
ncbi:MULTISPECIES: major coat protein [unclassified Providencia]|uniref:major coat protein n=1 Tax=unclassified Providencia TaxID=2633465 RepID=UPI0023498CD1|nr:MULTISPECIES: major coat protein [unclassified Providencia]